MSIPKLKKIKSDKKYNNIVLEDEYAWVYQPDILEFLKNANKLNPEVKKYINANNKITKEQLIKIISILRLIRTIVFC